MKTLPTMPRAQRQSFGSFGRFGGLGGRLSDGLRGAVLERSLGNLQRRASEAPVPSTTSEPIARPVAVVVNGANDRGSEAVSTAVRTVASGTVDGRMTPSDHVDSAAGTPGPAPVVSLHDVVAVLGRFPALAGASLDVAAGEILLLQGPNGAGKTTLLRLCAGLVPLARGSALVLGHDLRTDRADIRRHVGLLGHQNGLYADLSVRENVRFWGRTSGASVDEIDAALARLGLDGRLASVAAGRLSAGQRRRTALACLIARRARLWLLDEPHAGLDADGRDLLDEVIRHAVRAGATVMVASHELERAEALATRVVTVSGGLVHDASGDPGRPGTGRVA